MVNMGNVWDRTTEFLSDNLGAVVPIALLTVFLPAIIIQTLTGAIMEIGIATVYTVTLLLALPALWGQLFVIGFALVPEAGGASAQRGATRSFGRALLAMLVLFAVWAVLALPIAIAFTSSGIDIVALRAGSSAAFDAVSGTAVTFMFCYGLLLSIVIAFVITRLTMLYPVIVAERGVIAALRRAFALSRGIFWRVFGVMILFGLVYAVAQAAVGSVFGLLFHLLEPNAGPFGIGAIIVAILSGMLRTAYTLLISVFVAKLYQAATSTREDV